MAELGDFVAQGRRKHCEVTLEMMDYKHVDGCSDVPELRSILQALKSGEHGKYPHLERHTEKRILDLLPEKDRKRSKRSPRRRRRRTSPTPRMILIHSWANRRKMMTDYGPKST